MSRPRPAPLAAVARRPAVVLLAAALGTVVAVAVLEPARAEEAPRVTLEVGESRTTTGFNGRCDDGSVVSITIGPPIRLEGLKVGRTTCSWTPVNGAPRRIVEVVVVAPKPADPKGAKEPSGDKQAEPPRDR